MDETKKKSVIDYDYLEQKINDFTLAHQGESAEEILAQMRGEEPIRCTDIDEQMTKEGNL